jgi:hypothetical protein
LSCCCCCSPPTVAMMPGMACCSPQPPCHDKDCIHSSQVLRLAHLVVSQFTGTNYVQLRFVNTCALYACTTTQSSLLSCSHSMEKDSLCSVIVLDTTARTHAQTFNRALIFGWLENNHRNYLSAKTLILFMLCHCTSNAYVCVSACFH